MLELVIWPNMMLLGWTETKLWILKYASKSLQTSLILRQRPPKPYKLFNFFLCMISVILFKMGEQSDFHLSFFQIVTIGAWRDFIVVTKTMKNFKSFYGFGGRCVKIRDVCMDFEAYFNIHSLVSVNPKSIIFGQMTNLNMNFRVVVSVYWFVKIWNLPQFPAELRNGQLSELFWGGTKKVFCTFPSSDVSNDE